MTSNQTDLAGIVWQIVYSVLPQSQRAAATRALVAAELTEVQEALAGLSDKPPPTPSAPLVDHRWAGLAFSGQRGGLFDVGGVSGHCQHPLSRVQCQHGSTTNRQLP